VLGFRRRHEQKGFQGGQLGYPMMTEKEYIDFFEDRLTRGERERLFENKDLTVFLEEI